MSTKKFSEAMSEISDKYYDEVATYKAKTTKHSWLKYGSLVACFAFVALIGIGAFQNGFFISSTPQGDQGNNLDGNYYSAGNNPSGDEVSEQNPQEILQEDVELVVNQVSEFPITSDVDVEISTYDELPHDELKLIEEEFFSYTGISFEDFVTFIPEELRENLSFYSLATRGYKDAEMDNEYRLHDYVFDCHSNNGTQLTIALCNFEEPVRDCFIHDENPEVSNIHGIPTIIYEYENTYMVQFSYGGVYYDIETTNMSLDTLEALLVDIVS